MAVKISRLHLLLGGLLAVLLVRVVIVPFFSWRSDSVQNIEHMHNKVQKLESIYSSRDKITGSLAELEECMTQVQQYFLPVSETGEPAQLTVQKYIEDLVSSMGISLVNLEWMNKSVGPLLTQVPLKITFQCYLDQLYGFVHSIESHTLFLSIDSMTIGADRNSRLGCILEISAYSLTPAPVPAPVPPKKAPTPPARASTAEP